LQSALQVKSHVALPWHSKLARAPDSATQSVVPGQMMLQSVVQVSPQLALPSQEKVTLPSPASTQSVPPEQEQVRVCASQLQVPEHSSTATRGRSSSSSPQA
jgi:hypothetical protein